MKLFLKARNDISSYMEKAQRTALGACKGKYRINRNPAVAALYDGDPLVRAGASMILCATFEGSGRITPNTLPVLKTAIQREKDDQVKVIMETMYERLKTLTR